MLTALLYHVEVHHITRSKVRITLTPNWFGDLFRRRQRVGPAVRARADDTGEWCWWWAATMRHVGNYVERYIEAAPLLQIEDMSVEQLLLDEPETKREAP